MNLTDQKTLHINPETSGNVAWKSPSNLAIVKYWGKYGDQLPRNPSLSLTLNKAFTQTRISYHYHDSPGLSIDFRFEGDENKKFEERIRVFLSGIKEYFPMLNNLHLSIDSENSFPHSSGIASSASSMSALAMCLCDIEDKLAEEKMPIDNFLQKASYIARLGSGSACRSLYPHAALWGYHHDIEHSSNEYAIPYAEKIDETFKTLHDDILIVSGEEKSVSSSAGHALMDDNIYAASRYKQAHNRVVQLAEAMKTGDIVLFGKIAEDEALTLHALMMCSNPSYMLIEPGSIAIMKKVRDYRNDTGDQVYFSLDAGPNIHLLYPHSIKNKIDTFIESELKQYCHHGKIIHDNVGRGPERL